MAAAQAAESRHALRAVCLFAVLVTAKTLTLLVLAGSTLPASIWSPFAYCAELLVASVLCLAAPRRTCCRERCLRETFVTVDKRARYLCVAAAT